MRNVNDPRRRGIASATPPSRSPAEGAAKAFQWTNPHTWVEKDPSGKEVEWSGEGDSPNGLVHEGWSRQSLKPGDKATIVVHPLKDGTNGGSLVSAKVNGQLIGKRG